jgi:hypothetical protein
MRPASWVWLVVIWVGCGPDAPDADAGPGIDASARDAGATDSSCTPELVYAPDLLPECPDCAGARCVEETYFTSEEQGELRDCSDSHECVPDEYLLTGGDYIPVSCRAAFGAEGRCLSQCLAAIHPARDALPQGDCPDTHRCVACFDPITGADNGACTVGCDPGPAEPAVVLDRCCEDRAVCVPEGDVPASGRPYYDACEGAGTLCIPIPIFGRPDYVPRRCTAERARETYGDEYGPGACAHSCQRGVAAVAAFYDQDDCDEDFLCIPCLDPRDGSPTGACALFDE